MTQQHPAGWYRQPDGSHRYWNGSQWIEHATPPLPSQPAVPGSSQPTYAMPPQQGNGMPPQPAAPTSKPLWQKKRVIIPAAALAMVIGVSALSGGGGDTQNALPATTPSLAHSSQEPTTSPLPAEPSPSQPVEAAEPQTFAMPDLVGMNLQEAQDELQALGSYLMDQQDASGAGRLQLDDSNWHVCTQAPVAGEDVPVSATVILSSVKNNEDCPSVRPTKPAVAMTTSQEQAVRKAEQYLDYTAFSRKGLIDQLKYEGFSKKDATFAVDHIEVDWKDQAVAKAENYLDYSSFSRKGLIDQLKYEGFSKKQATYAVDHIEVDWNEQAAKKAEQYLDHSSFSRKGLIAQLEFEGFTRKQAEFGVKAVGL